MARHLGWDRRVAPTVASWLVDRLAVSGRPLVVLSPESAGVLLGDAVARELGAELAVLCIDEARRATGELRAGGPLEGRDVLVVDDVATTGATLARLHDAARRHGGRPIAAALFAVVHADAVTTTADRLGVRCEWLASARWPTYVRADCPGCAEGLPELPATELN